MILKFSELVTATANVDAIVEAYKRGRFRSIEEAVHDYICCQDDVEFYILSKHEAEIISAVYEIIKD